MKSLERSFNVAAAAVGLLTLSPLFLLIAAAIKCCDGGPIFYRQGRVGRDFRTFRLLKFRSMAPGAERHGLLTGADDPRVTRVGRWLRKYKLDELPQLWNVLAGDMQLVGARPEVEPYVSMFRDEYQVLLSEPPGITDPASLAYRDEENRLASGEREPQYVTQILPDKLRLSLQYQRQRTFASDLQILAKTLLRIAA